MKKSAHRLLGMLLLALTVTNTFGQYTLNIFRIFCTKDLETALFCT